MFTSEEREFARKCKLELDVFIAKAKAFAAGGSPIPVPPPVATAPVPPFPPSPYLSAEEAAAYLGKSLSWFYKRSRRIKRCPQNKMYLREDLDAFAEAHKPRFTRPGPKQK